MSWNPDAKTKESGTLREVIKGFLNNYEFLHEYRLQKLIYMVDLLAVEESGERLTNADFMPFMYGSYAEDIGDNLEDLEKEDDNVEAKPDMHHGKVTKAFVGEDIAEEEISSEVIDLVGRVHSATKGVDNEELASWSKETWLYENTRYGEEMDFDKYKQNLEMGRASSDLEKWFSE